MSYAMIDSPVGPLMLVGSDEGELMGVYMEQHRHQPPVETFGSRDDTILPDVVQQLREYFEGTRTTFDVRLKLVGTPFQQEVWKALQDIPYGETTSYGELAVQLGQVAAVVTRGRAGEREEPDQHHRAVPPGGRLDRQPDRVRRWARAQAAVARPRAGRRTLLKSGNKVLIG